MWELVLGWKRPDVDGPSVAAVDLFGAEHSRILRDRASSRQLTRARDMSCRNVERSSLTATRRSI